MILWVKGYQDLRAPLTSDVICLLLGANNSQLSFCFFPQIIIGLKNRAFTCLLFCSHHLKFLISNWLFSLNLFRVIDYIQWHALNCFCFACICNGHFIDLVMGSAQIVCNYKTSTDLFKFLSKQAFVFVD